MKFIWILILLLAVCSTGEARENHHYSRNGQYLGRSNTVGRTTYYYGSRGRYRGNSNTTKFSGSYYYGRSGHYRGRTSKPSRNFNHYRR